MLNIPCITRVRNWNDTDTDTYNQKENIGNTVRKEDQDN